MELFLYLIGQALWAVIASSICFIFSSSSKEPISQPKLILIIYSLR